MEGFRFFEVFPADVGWYQPSSTTCLLAAGNSMAQGEQKEEEKSCRVKNTYKNILQLREDVSIQCTLTVKYIKQAVNKQ